MDRASHPAGPHALTFYLSGGPLALPAVICIDLHTALEVVGLAAAAIHLVMCRDPTSWGAMYHNTYSSHITLSLVLPNIVTLSLLILSITGQIPWHLLHGPAPLFALQKPPLSRLILYWLLVASLLSFSIISFLSILPIMVFFI